MGGKGEGLALVSRRLRPRSPQSPTRGLTPEGSSHCPVSQARAQQALPVLSRGLQGLVHGHVNISPWVVPVYAERIHYPPRLSPRP